jgi:hypothetical protein
LALDHHYSRAIAEQLRPRGFDVIAAIERGWEAELGETLLGLCEQEQRALMTNNVADFAVIIRSWAVEGRQHAGLIFTSDASMPQGSRPIGHYLDSLETLMRSNLHDDAFADRLHWL